MNPMIRDYVVTLIRTLLLAGAGALVKSGLAEEGSFDELATGLATAIVTIGWALWSKYKARKHLVTALTLPQGSTENDVKAAIKSGVTPTVTTPSNTVPGVPVQSKKEDEI